MKKTFITTAILTSVLGFGALSAQETAASLPQAKKVEFKKRAVVTPDNKTVNPYYAATPSLSTRGEENEGTVLNEDFESWDGADPSWLPKGWSRDHRLLPPGNPGWRAYKPTNFYEEIKSACLVIENYYDPIDEWIITPSAKVEEGMTLSFLTFPTPVYYFDVNYVDWTIYEFTEMHIVNDFRVYVTEDDGENWTLIKSVASDFEDEKGYFELSKLTKETRYTLDLNAYAGKTIKIGFNVWGIDEGNTVMLDEVRVGYPSLDISYGRPDGSLYFGLSKYDEFLPVSILTVPVYSPVTFVNTSKDRSAKFSWEYQTKSGDKYSDNQRELTVNYTTDYSTEAATRNNLYRMPVLNAEKEKYAPTQFSSPGLLQAGGNCEYLAYYSHNDTYEMVNFGLSVLDPVTEGTATYADISVPYFGYNQASDYFWTQQMLNGDSDYTMSEDTYSHLESYGNLFFATEEPLVITGVRTNGYGVINPEAKFKAEIYLINSNWEVPQTPYASAICTGDDITVVDRGTTNRLLSFNFKFDEPIVMSTELTPYYFVTITGFRDPVNVEYYSPEMSEKDNAEGLALGWIGLKNKFMGSEYPFSWAPVYGYIEQYVGFYVMLDAYYPWLESYDEEVTLNDDGKAQVSFDSYYSGEELTVSGLPSWLNAETSGKYGDTIIKFTSSSSDDGYANVVVSAPGVSRTIKVNNTDTNGIDSIVGNEGKEVKEIYTLTGVKVKGDLTPGIYLFKYSDGTTRKILVK